MELSAIREKWGGLMAAIVERVMSPQRKRTFDAMSLREPDRVPVALWGTVEGYQNLRRGLGMELNENPMNYRTGSTTWTADVSFELDLAEKLDLDFVRISMSPPGGSPGPAGASRASAAARRQRAAAGHSLPFLRRSWELPSRSPLRPRSAPPVGLRGSLRSDGAASPLMWPWQSPPTFPRRPHKVAR